MARKTDPEPDPEPVEPPPTRPAIRIPRKAQHKGIDPAPAPSGELPHRDRRPS